MTRKQLNLGALALVFCAGLAYAGHWAVGEWRYRALLADRALVAGDRDVSVKREMACPDPAESLVFVVFGQSNAANHGSERLTAPDETFDFYEERCFAGDDPQFLATGKGGSPWPMFAFWMREGGETRPILTATVAVGNTPISEWLPGTPHAGTMEKATRGLQAKGYRIAGFLFFQGESDREAPEAVYRDGLAQIADLTGALSPATPLILSDSSVCELEEVGGDPVAALSNARASLAAGRSMVYVGPDTDTLGAAYRYDGCHFNRAGLERLGVMWADAVRDAIN